MTIDRRALLTGAGALGMLSVAGVTAAVQPAAAAPSQAKVIDVHTHMFSKGWMAAVRAARDPNFQLGEGSEDGSLVYRGASIGRIVPTMLDFDSRIKAMDAAKVDIALVSLTAPNVYWGTREQSAAAARIINDDFAAAEKKYDGRIRWMASLPWQNSEDSIAELRRARKNGAIGVCMLTNILGARLDDARFDAIWREIEAMRLPVFIHPTTPMSDSLGLGEYGFFNSIGFMTDTVLCFERMIMSGFMDRFPRLNLIACHGGGYLPYLAGRFDIMWARNDLHSPIKDAPSTYLRRLYYDAIVYEQDALEFLVKVVGADRVMYGSDYPFRIADMDGVLKRTDALPAEQRDAVRSGNALKIFDL